MSSAGPSESSIVAAAKSSAGMDVLATGEGTGVVEGPAVGPGAGVEMGKALRILIRSSMQRYTAPETPSSTLNRSSIASLVTLSMSANCSSVKVGGSCDRGERCW